MHPFFKNYYIIVTLKKFKMFFKKLLESYKIFIINIFYYSRNKLLSKYT